MCKFHSRNIITCCSRQVLQPLITAATLMTLTSLSGLLTMTYLMRINFKLEEKTKKFLMDNRKEDSDFKTPIQVRIKKTRN